MTKRIKGPTSKYTIPPLDKELFHTLFDILHDGCMEGNYAATSRILGISVLTARKWARQPPKQPWINHTLKAAINVVYGTMVNSSHKKIRKRAAKVKGQLERAGQNSMVEYLEYNEAAQSGAVRHLLQVLVEQPGHEIGTDDLRKSAFSGGYNMRTLRHAATTLQLDKEVEGFGEDKVTYYRLPRSEE